MKRKRIKIGAEKKEMPTSDLLSVLELVDPAVATKSLADFSQEYIFLDDTISAWNGSLLITAPFKSGITGFTRAFELFNLVKKMETSPIHMKLNKGKGLLVVKTGDKEKKQASLNFTPGLTTVHDTVMGFGYDKMKWKKLPENVRDGIVLCSFAASKDLLRTDLTGVYISKGVVASSDNYRVSLFQHDAKISTIRIPAPAGILLKNYPIIKYNIGTRWVHFSTDDGVVVSSSIIPNDGEHAFPIKIVEKMLLKQKGFNYELPVTKLNKAFDRAAVLLADEYILDRAVTMDIHKSITVKSTKTGFGTYEEKIKTKWSLDDPVTIRINPEFLREAMSHGTSFKIDKKKFRLIIEAGDFRHLINLHGE